MFEIKPNRKETIVIQKQPDRIVEGLEVKIGKNGTDGADGKDGKSPQKNIDYFDGLSAYELAISQGFVGTLPEWILSLKGERGKDGYTPIKGIDYFDGAQGLMGEKGDSGYSPIKNVDYFDGIQGNKGDDGESGYTPIKGVDYFDGVDGKSAYQLALQNGFVGTEIDWINSLKGERGDVGISGSQGDDGKSAYELAVISGFVGTESQWLTSLMGLKGDTGIGLIVGGTTGQILAKKTNANFDTEWISPPSTNVVSSVFSRTGNVSAQSGDYSLSQITEDSTHRSVTDIEKSTWNSKEPAITKATGFNLPLTITPTDIKMNGTQSVGVATTLPRADHVHPTDTSRAASSHTHGNLTNSGAIGSTANLPLITTTSGVVTTGTFGTTANTFCQGNDARLSDSRSPLSHTHTTSEVTGLDTSLSGKQPTLISGTNIKTVNGTSLLGEGDLVISGGGGATDPIQLADRSTPSAPVSGLTIFSRKRAGRSSLNQIGSSGIDTPLQPALFGNSVYLWLPGATTGVSIAFSTAWTARNTSGAQSHPAKATTNFLTQMNRALFSCTATTLTSSGIQSTNTVGARGNANGIGGFYYFSRFGVETLSGTGQQILLGLSALNAVLGGEPSVQANTIGICKDSTDTNWQLVSRNATTSTKVDTGIPVVAGQVFSLYMFCKSNDSKITVRLVRENDGVVVLDDVEVTATLPVNTVFMYAHAQLRNTGTAINALALNRIYVECDI